MPKDRAERLKRPKTCSLAVESNPKRQRLSEADSVAQAVIAAFLERTNHNFLPKTRSNGFREWTCLSGIVMENALEGSYTCVALGSGLKCLSSDQLATGLLFDTHAEVVCKRAFRKFLYSQLQSCAHGLEESIFAEYKPFFMLKPHYRFHIYISQLPCGSAALLLQASESREGGDLRLPTLAFPGLCQSVYRGHYGWSKEVGDCLRTKPGRGDAKNCASLSCTDKLTSWALLGLQGSLMSAFIAKGVYLSTVNVPFGAHLLDKILAARLDGLDVNLKPPKVRQTLVEFPYSQPSELATSSESRQKFVGSNLSVAGWLCSNGSFELEYIANARKFGKPKPRPPLYSGQSQLSKLSLFEDFKALADNLGQSSRVCSTLATLRSSGKFELGYSEFKRAVEGSLCSDSYRELKEKVFREHPLLKYWLHTNLFLPKDFSTVKV